MKTMKDWFYRKFYREDVKDSITIGRLTIHLCGPWDYGAPLRLHFSWMSPGMACNYCGYPWDVEKGRCSRKEKHYRDPSFDSRPIEGLFRWMFAFGLWPGHGFAQGGVVLDRNWRDAQPRNWYFEFRSYERPSTALRPW